MRRGIWIAGLAAVAALAAAPAAQAEDFVAASSNTGGRTLYFFSSDGLGVSAQSSRAVTGLQDGDRVAGLDVRPATGELYALGFNGSSVALYTLDTSGDGPVAAAMLPGRVGVRGVSFGFDFNPTVDRLRQTSDAELNRRLNPIEESVRLVQEDGDLAYAAGDPRAGRDPQVVASAYTNNDNDPDTGTTLFDIDSGLDRLVTQIPPNDGTLNSVGLLGRNVSGNAGFDIDGADNDAYAVLQPAGNTGPSSLNAVDLATGRATRIADLDGPRLNSLAILPGLG